MTINSYDNTNIHFDTRELEKSILQIFLQTSVSSNEYNEIIRRFPLQNVSRNSTYDTFVFDDYEHENKQYRRMKIHQRNSNEFLGNSIIAVRSFRASPCVCIDKHPVSSRIILWINSSSQRKSPVKISSILRIKNLKIVLVNRQ